MRPIPQKLRQEMSEDKFYSRCARLEDGECEGRITWEHAFIYAGKQINEKWAIVPLCERHHLGEGLNKEINQWIAINRATDEDFKKYPKKDWQQLKKYLNNKYGIPPILSRRNK